LTAIETSKPALDKSGTNPAAARIETPDVRGGESGQATSCETSSQPADQTVDKKNKATFFRFGFGVSRKRTLIAVCLLALPCALFLSLREASFFANPETIAAMDLKVIGLHIQMQMDTQSPDYTSNPNIKKLRGQISEKINGAEINAVIDRLDRYEILIANLPPSFMDVRPSNHLVAYEKKAPADGGLTVTLDGQVRKISANDLQQLLARMKTPCAKLNKTSNPIATLLDAYFGTNGVDLSITDQCLVRFPGEYATEKRALPTPMGNIDATMFSFDAGDMSFLANHTKYSVGFVEKAASDRKAFLEKAASAGRETKQGSRLLHLNVEKQNGIYVLEQEFSFDAGINSKGQSFPSGKSSMKVYLDGNELYLFGVQINDDIARSDPDGTQLLTTRFFESIRFKYAEVERPSIPDLKNEGSVDRFDLGKIPIPEFPELTELVKRFPTGESMYRVTLNGSLDQPGASMSMRVYLPAGSHEPQSIACVLVGPSGTNLLTGINMESDDYHSETLPYAQKGMAAVTFSLDGEYVAEGATDVTFVDAHGKFQAACAGLVNVRNALEFTLQKLPQVNPARIYCAGHNSAGTLSLLFAEHEPRLAGCLAFAPITDIQSKAQQLIENPGSATHLPGLRSFVRQSSPVTHVQHLQCPVFVFHAMGDLHVPCARTIEFVNLLRKSNTKVTFLSHDRGDQVLSMINEGLPSSIQWLRALQGMPQIVHPTEDDPKREHLPAGVFFNSIGMKFVPIPKGAFKMGSPQSEKASESDERRHPVTITQDYYLGVYEVTQAQYEKVMGRNPSYFQVDEVPDRRPESDEVFKHLASSSYPVDQVSWEDAVKFCSRLSALSEEEKAGRVYRLPTEAEWEYACRAGSKAAYCFGDGAESLEEYAWYGDNAQGTTHEVGKKKPNVWGLYDMHGNVWEWCSDRYGEYPPGAVTDPQGPLEGWFRVRRGGSWRYMDAGCRSAYRFYLMQLVDFSRDGGFRLALSASRIQK